MAQLDVSTVLIDPLFTSEVTLIHSEEGFDSDFNVEWSEGASVTVKAVVTSDQKAITNLPEALRRDGMISVRVLKTLIPESFQGGGFDAVEWRGKRFIVNSTSDYSQFGKGMIRCICSPAEVSNGSY